MPKHLTEADIELAAEQLGIEVAAIRAVDEVESLGSGFLPDGRVRILFERHKFHEYTHGAYDHSHPDISNRKAGGYGRAGANQYARFSKAFELDPEAAMKSASWGRYQIMGFNFKPAGFNNVGEFVDAMKVSEGSQLIAFVNVIKNWGLTGELKAHDWAAFARQYNGPQFRKNRYDTKMAEAYQRFRTDSDPIRHHATYSKPVVHASPDTDKPAPMDEKGLTTSPDKPKSETEGTLPPAPAMEIKASRPSLKSVAASVVTFLLAPLSWFGIDVEQVKEQGLEFAKGNVALAIKLGFAFAVIVLAVWVWNRAMDRANNRTLKVMDAAKDQDANNLRLV